MNIDELRAEAARRNLTGRTLKQVQADLASAQRRAADVDLARLMLRFGQLTPEARQWIEKRYPQA